MVWVRGILLLRPWLGAGRLSQGSGQRTRSRPLGAVVRTVSFGQSGRRIPADFAFSATEPAVLSGLRQWSVPSGWVNARVRSVVRARAVPRARRFFVGAESRTRRLFAGAVSALADASAAHNMNCRLLADRQSTGAGDCCPPAWRSLAGTPHRAPPRPFARREPSAGRSSPAAEAHPPRLHCEAGADPPPNPLRPSRRGRQARAKGTRLLGSHVIRPAAGARRGASRGQ